ncbi:uncharacterized protein J3R85_006041 [Psidium guajava]|nr:uncharacterized protein J3R85_006041 [Psidium guajava]
MPEGKAIGSGRQLTVVHISWFFPTRRNAPPSGPCPSEFPPAKDGEDEQATEVTVITTPPPPGSTVLRDESEQPKGPLTSSLGEQGSFSSRVVAVNQQGSSWINRYIKHRSYQHIAPLSGGEIS